jgi:general secretion pathway protein B
MSFILDALKKSENERQRVLGPSLADVRVIRRNNERPWWVIAVAALLVVNLGVLLVVLMRDGNARSVAPLQQAPMQAAPQQGYLPAPQVQGAPQQGYVPAPQAQGAPQQGYIPAPQAQAAPAQNYNPAAGYGGGPAQQYQQPPQQQRYQPNIVPTDRSVRSLADEARGYGEGGYADESMSPHLAGAANVPEGPSIVRPIQPPSVAPLPAQSVAEARNAAAGGGSVADVATLPTLDELTASGTNLPELHLDIHVSSQNPAERFVFVNMRKYVEGDTLKEGPSVERITPEGVVLNQRGLRFLLPRQ